MYRCKECNKDYLKAWRAKHPEKNSEYGKQAYIRHPNRYKYNTRRWKLNHPEHHRRLKRVAEGARRAHKLNQFIEDVDPQVVYEMHGGMCGVCKQFIEDDFHVDHVIPLSKGGMHGYVNVQPAHPSCNLRKGNR